MTATSIRVTEHYSTGPYEWVEIGAEVSGEVTNDQELSELEFDLDQAMQSARERVAQLTTNDQSMIHDHPALTGEA